MIIQDSWIWLYHHGDCFCFHDVQLGHRFSVSQLGMVVRTGKERQRKWLYRTVGSGGRFALTAIACLIFGITLSRAEHGWVIVCVPLMILMFSKIQHHYQQIGEDLKYDFSRLLQPDRHTIRLVPITSVNKPSAYVLGYALANFKNIVAVLVMAQNSQEAADETERVLREQWARLNSDVRLVRICLDICRQACGTAPDVAREAPLSVSTKRIVDSTQVVRFGYSDKRIFRYHKTILSVKRNISEQRQIYIK